MKVPNPRKLKNGTYFIQLRLDGRSISISDKDKNKCIARAAAIKSGLTDAKNDNNVTLAKAIDRYIESRSNVLSPSTLRGYRTIQRNRFQNYMNKKITVFTREFCQRMVNDERQICGAKTIANAWGLVSSAICFETGLRHEIRLPQIVAKESAYLNPNQIKIFLKGVEGKKIEIPALLALHSLRRSELLALNISDIDKTKQQIYVRKSLVPNDEDKFVEKDENKNKKSRRIVPIIIPRLLELVSNIEEGKLVDHNINTLTRNINNLCSELELPRVGLHGLRHSFASLAYELNIPKKVTMDIGGWGDDKTMEKIYTHISTSYINDEAKKLKQFFE